MAGDLDLKNQATEDDSKKNDDSLDSTNVTRGENENDEKSLEIDISPNTSNEATSSKEKADEVKPKRKHTDSHNSSPPAKKVRNKPKPQTIDNMKEYIENNTIDKLTTVTLRNWLKQRALQCTTRDKKQDLIQKVRNHFLST